jgi:chromosome segregation protein
MYLKRLEIQGFKSFAKNTVLEYERGITAIVGPNGSGKSNVADSLRWVLGEQSAKLIRGKKSDDVIFAGSDKKVRAGFAEVIATFDNRDHKIPLDYSEVSIGRRIDRSGESEYLINGNRVRLLDVVDLVLKSNIGTSRYTVIGQGTIDNMILSGPVEIKNLIDEASGVKTYYIRRDRTLRRLEQTAQNLMRAEDLIAELEPRVKSLRRQAKRMEAREVIEQELKGYQKEYLGSNYWRLTTASGSLFTQAEEMHARRSALEQSAQAHLEKIERHEKDNAEQLSGFQRLQAELQTLQQKKNGLLENISLIRGKMQSQKTSGGQDAASLRIDQHTLTQRVADLREQLAKSVSQMEQAQTSSQQSQSALAELNQKLDAVYETLRQPAGDPWLGNLERELTVLERAFNNFYDTVQAAEDVETIKPQATALLEQWQKFRQAVQKAAGPNTQTGEAAQLQSQMQELSRRKDSLAAEYNNFTMAASKAALSRDFLEQQLAKAEQDLLQTNLDLKKAASSSGHDFIRQMVEEEAGVQKDIAGFQKKIAAVEQSLQDFYDAENRWKASIAEEDKSFRSLQQQISDLRDQEAAVQIEKAKYDTQLEALNTEIDQSLGAEIAAEIRRQKTAVVEPDKSLEDKISKLKHQLELIGGVDELTLQEYHETEARYTSLSEQVGDLKKSMDDLRAIMDELDQHIKVKFNEAFHKVNSQFENYFRILFNGGRAYLSLIRPGEDKAQDSAGEGEEGEDESDEGGQLMRPEEKVLAKYERGSLNVTGVDIRATPPGKKLSTIQALSGGERALTSIALLCSLLACFPSPFVVLDEVDAALDEANTIRFGQILGTLAHQTQFITITHNRETMAQSNMLYGVTMGDDGISKLLSIKLDQARTYAK